MIFRFKRTGATVDVPVAIHGDEWELVDPPENQAEEKQTKKPTRSRKKAKSGDGLRND